MFGEDFDQEIAVRTLRFRYSGVRFTTRGQVIGSLRTILDVATVDGIFKVNKDNAWYVTFKTEKDTRKFGCGKVLEIDENITLTIERIDNRRVTARVHWYPMYMKVDYVREFFARYGDRVKVSYEHTTFEELTIKTGSLRVEMTCEERAFQDIPTQTTIKGKDVLITVMGRPVTCLKCGGSGHTRQYCKKEEGTQQKSYAQATATTTITLPDDTAEEVQVSHTDSQRRQQEESSQQDQMQEEDTPAKRNGPPARQAREGAGDPVKKRKDMGPLQDKEEPGQKKKKDGGEQITEEVKKEWGVIADNIANMETNPYVIDTEDSSS